MRRRAVIGALVAVLAVSCSRGGHHDKTERPTTTTHRDTDTPTTTTSGSGGHARPDDRALIGAALFAGTTKPTGGTYTAPGSIAHDCSRDVTTALSSWLDTVPDNATIELPRRGCYRVEGTFLIGARKSLRIDGNGTTIEAKTRGGRDRAHVSIERSTNIFIDDLIVRGADAAAGTPSGTFVSELEAQHAFQVLGAEHVMLQNVQAYNPYGDFVYIGETRRSRNHPDPVPSAHVAVVGSRFARNGRQGISLTNATNVALVGNEISDVQRSMFNLEPNTATDTVRNVLIEDNTTGHAVNYWFADKGQGDRIGNVIVSGNVMAATTGGLVFVFGRPGGQRGPYTFKNNTLQVTGDVTDENAVGGMLFQLTANVTIENNDITLGTHRPMPLLELRDAHRITVRDNRVVHAARLVMADAASSDVHVTGNH